MTNGNETKCAIWPDVSVKDHQSDIQQGVAWYVSLRAGGDYQITRQAERKMQHIGATVEAQRIRARLTTWLVEMRQQGEEWPLVTTEVIRRVSVSHDLIAYERADRLLRYLVSLAPTLGSSTRLGNDEFINAMVVSESINLEEVNYLARFLNDQGLIAAQFAMSDNYLIFQVTVPGHAQIAQRELEVDSSQTFVAMWFDPSVNGLYERGIGPAVEAAGYKPLRIDQKPDANKIDDEIIAEIRRSRFVVADCTHGDDGARGGVYYEAGFAYGLNIPVIFTCRQDMFDKIHFDTRQYNHIGWGEPEDLVEPLKNRILTRIGEGPGRR